MGNRSSHLKTNAGYPGSWHRNAILAVPEKQTNRQTNKEANKQTGSSFLVFKDFSSAPPGSGYFLLPCCSFANENQIVVVLNIFLWRLDPLLFSWM